MIMNLLLSGYLIIPGLIMILSSLTIILLKKWPPLFLTFTNCMLFLVEVFYSFFVWSKVKNTINSESFNVLTIDWLSFSLITISSITFFIASVFSIYYIEKDHFGSYYTLLGSLQLGVNLVLLANHFFYLFIFWELMVISGYILVIFENKAESYEAGFKYLIMSSMGSLFILLGIALLSGVIPNLSFSETIEINLLDSFAGRLAISSLIVGFGVTAGMFGLNQWLADAHPAAPAPISTLLSGIVVKLGIYGIYRSLTVLLPSMNLSYSSSTIIVIIAVITMTEGNFMVISQFMRDDVIDFKRILAYSTTVHLGYLLLVVGFNSELGNIALIFHIINHTLAKGLLFMISGYLIHEYGSKDLKLLESYKIGLNDKYIAISASIALFSLGGLPLTGGFVSKLFILISFYNQIENLTDTNQIIMSIALVIAVVNSAMAFSGYLWVIKILFFNQENNNQIIISHNGRYIKILFMILAIAIVLLGVFPFILIDFLVSIIN